MKKYVYFILCLSLIPAVFAETDVSDKNAQLIQAAKYDNLSTVQNLLANGADINAKDKNGKTALMLAARDERTRIVKALLAKGADVNVKDKDGKTVWKLK